MSIRLHTDGESHHTYLTPVCLPSCLFSLLPHSFLQLPYTEGTKSVSSKSESQIEITDSHDSHLPQGWGYTHSYRSHTPMTSLLQDWGWTPRIAIFHSGEAAPANTDHTPSLQQSSTGVRLHSKVQITLPRDGFLQGWGCTCKYRSYTHTHDNNLP